MIKKNLKKQDKLSFKNKLYSAIPCNVVIAFSVFYACLLLHGKPINLSYQHFGPKEFCLNNWLAQVQM